eukprot:scaffold93825_cov14-Tisochrysis_lutea.AAC.1
MKATIPTPTSPALIIQACPRERHKGPHILILTASQRRVPVAIHAKTRHAHPVGQVWSMPAGFFVPTAAFSRQSFLEVWMEMREAVAQTAYAPATPTLCGKGTQASEQKSLQRSRIEPPAFWRSRIHGAEPLGLTPSGKVHTWLPWAAKHTPFPEI